MRLDLLIEDSESSKRGKMPCTYLFCRPYIMQ